MAVVFSPDHRQVLLLRREFLLLWDLPGGGVEKGEDPARAAVRETSEETGYDIEIDGLSGRYVHQSVYGRGDQLTFAFRAHVVGGKPRHIGVETMGLRWADINQFPRGLEPLQRQIIADAVVHTTSGHDTGPFERRIDFPRWKLYPARVVFSWVRIQNAVLNAVLRKH